MRDDPREATALLADSTLSSGEIGDYFLNDVDGETERSLEKPGVSFGMSEKDAESNVKTNGTGAKFASGAALCASAVLLDRNPASGWIGQLVLIPVPSVRSM